jgi:glutathione S-transferase
MEFELISFDRCPYVQRSVITLLHKNIDFQITYIDLADKPDWFVAISPFGRVPALRVRHDGQESVLFESVVINEFLDEVTPGRLLPEDAIERALCRSWIEFGSALFSDSYYLTVANDRAEFEKALEALRGHAGRVEEILGDGPYFCGSNFSLVDAAYAPFFMRAAIWGDVFDSFDREVFPRFAAWGDALLALPEVRDSVIPDLAERVRKTALEKGRHIGQLMAAAA